MRHYTFALAVPFRAIAIVTVVSLVMWSLGIPSWLHTAQASTVSTFSDTLSTSAPGVASTSTLQFTITSAMYALETMQISFDTAAQLFDLSGIASSSVTVSGGSITQVADQSACSGTASELYFNAVNTTSDYVELRVCVSDTIATSTAVQVVVGDMVNPSATGSYIIGLGGTNANEGDTQIAIVDEVTVTAAVNTTFTFSVNAVNAGTTVNGDATVTSGTTTATSVPFGTISPNTDYLLAQTLRVDTNAQNGFSVTVEADQTLTAGNSATIDEFIDGAATASSTAWVNPTGSIGTPDTYGHWGITSDDDAVSSTTPNLWGSGATPFYAGNFIANPVEVFYHGTPVQQTSGVGVGSTTVAYKLRITNLQEAAKDYTSTLTYIATPVF